MAGWLRVSGSDFVADGEPVRLRGAGLGGWLNMENFITGFAGNESLMRATVRTVLGDERYEAFFDRLLTVFFAEPDARLLAETGLNCLRIPVNYRHFEDDDRPFEIKPDGFRRLDRVIDLCGRHGIYTVIDLHALPGCQNHHWHSDNPTHLPMFWAHSHFQDRVVHLWEQLADHYKDNAWVAGYNPVNEPADESGQVVRRCYARLVRAIRAIDDRHILFLDGNTYSTEFDIFDEPVDNTVYVCHDYVPAGLGAGGPYPGETGGVWCDKAAAERKFLQRTEYARRTGTPIWVGEFGPIYPPDPDVAAQRSQILADQLDIYRAHNASWSIWTYKDLGLQGLVTVRPDSAYGRHFADFLAKKNRLGADAWSTNPEGPVAATLPFRELIAREFPDFDPYPWGASRWIRGLLMNIGIAEPLAYEYAELFRGLGHDDLLALADSFTFDNCTARQHLLRQLTER